LGDVDGDGDLDLVAGNNTSQANRVWLNNGLGTFSDSGQTLGAFVTLSVALDDVDGDGDLDLIEGNSGSANRVWFNNGLGTFSDSGQTLGNHDTHSVALGDVDRDGDLDLVEGNYQQANQVWLNNGLGTFNDSGQTLGNYWTQGLALGDVDGDGDLDLVEGNEGQANRVWLNPKTSQTISAITFNPTALSVGGATTASATATSGLPVTFSSQTTSTCTVSGITGSTVTGVTEGTCTIAANQAGNATYNPAPQVTQNLAVNKINQTIGAITFSPTTLTIGGTTTASATATSNLPVTFSSQTTGICTVNGSIVTAVTEGTCIVAADQAGNATYNAAAQVTQSIGVGKIGQTISTITFNPTTLIVNGLTTVSATATSGLPVTFTSQTTGVCTVAGSAVTGVTEGTCIVAADQAGDATYNAAAQVTQSIGVGKIVYTVTPVAGTGGVLQPATPQTVSDGSVATFTVTPNSGYQTGAVTGCNGTLIGNRYTTGAITGDCTISATFHLIVSPPPPPAAPSRLLNLSSRGWVGPGDALVIDGFILGGGDAARPVIVRALGPTLANAGLPTPLANPRLRVTTVTGEPIADNDDWMQAPNAAALEARGYAPPDPHEAALLLTLKPNVPYTVLVDGVDYTTGTALVEILDPEAGIPTPRLVNLSARGWVGINDDLLIGGLILGGGAAPRQILVRVLGPTLAEAQLADTLANPQITLTTLDGRVLAENDDWNQSAQAAAIAATGLAPPDPREPALLLTLDPNTPYTVLVRGVDGTTGLVLLEILELP
ncbi:MAG: VCBS repeat-containing protein, partial [Candidatus Competibacteraceae bacterium]|nr:VCBS repeat-containing protein [Candidatus Competibacteraceae bacterium]